MSAQITTSFELVSPEGARAFLGGNADNRKIRPSVVDHLAKQILMGRWITTHQGIAIAPDGRLLDGQHRLRAIIKAGMPVMMAVSRNVPACGFSVMDGAGGGAGQRTLKDATRVDARILDPCTLMARILNGGRKSGKVTPADVMPIVDGPLGRAVGTLVEVYGGAARGRSAAPVKLGAAMRLLYDPTDYVEAQWHALLSLDFPAMSGSTQALCRMLTKGGDIRSAQQGGMWQLHVLVRAWRAFDPKRPNAPRIAVPDRDADISEIVSLFRSAETLSLFSSTNQHQAPGA